MPDQELTSCTVYGANRYSVRITHSY